MTRLWQYKVYADIRGGSEDLCKFSLDLRMPEPIYVVRYMPVLVVNKISLFFVVRS